MNPENERAMLRQTMRERRSTLPACELASADEHLAANVTQLIQSKDLYQKNIRVAGYLAADGEISLSTSFEQLHADGLQTCVPVIREGILKFASLTPQTPLRKGKFGIAVPICDEADLLEANTIDVILSPLLAFDSIGNRLGMGGGYYDRTLAHLHPAAKVDDDARTQPLQQLFVGVAHAFQKLDHIPIESWDVPLHAAVTNQGLYDFRSM